MPKTRVEHFDCATLVRAVHDQPLGLAISTNHPAGFRRLLYLYLRQNPQAGRLNILQSPDSANMFYLVKAEINLKEQQHG